MGSLTLAQDAVLRIPACDRGFHASGHVMRMRVTSFLDTPFLWAESKQRVRNLILTRLPQLEAKFVVSD